MTPAGTARKSLVLRAGHRRQKLPPGKKYGQVAEVRDDCRSVIFRPDLEKDERQEIVECRSTNSSKK